MGKCAVCDENCETCDARGTCTTCFNGTFFNSITQVCELCTPNCLNCDSETTCSMCNTTFFFDSLS